MTARLLMIGIDAADAQQLDSGSLDGSLPHMAALRRRGCVKRLEAPAGVTDDTLWASFHYGTELGDHGRYHYLVSRRDGRLGMAYLDEAPRAAFWDRLSDAGLRVAILDVPKCRAPRPLNGFHLADWRVHGRYFSEPQSYPEDLAAAVVERFGPAPASRCGYHQPQLSDEQISDFMDDLRISTARKCEAGLHFLAAEPWDLFVIGFKEAHCASHAFWDFEADHPAHNQARAARLAHPVMTVLEDLDAAVGKLVAAAGEKADVLVFSTSEFQPNGGLNHLMPEVAARLNARLAKDRWGLLTALARHMPLPGAPAWRCEILPYNENCIALRVNQGRKAGFAPAAASPPAALMSFLVAALEGLRDADSGEAVFSAISQPSSQCAGERRRDLPDLLAICVSGRFPQAIVSPMLGRIAAVPAAYRPGNHVAGGVIIAAGARATAGAAQVHTIGDLAGLARAVLA